MAGETDKYDLIVIGSGPAGYTGAIRAAQLGFRVACVEAWKTYGGTCLNIGCIPSKALLESSENFVHAKTKLAKHGVIAGDVKLDLAQMLKRKNDIVRQLTTGIGGLLRKNKIDGIVGKGKLGASAGGQHTVEVATDSGKRTISAPRVLIATGSEPVQLPFLPFDGKRVISSTEALALPEVPQHLVVVGGGVIGLELGSVWLRLGARVTVIEFQDRIVPPADKQIGAELFKVLKKQGMEFRLSTKCLGAKQQGKFMIVDVEEMPSGAKSSLECDVVLVATGRKPYTEGLGLDEKGIKRDKAGRIEIDPHFQTNVAGVFAVGDVVAGPMLAHKAEEEAVAAVELMAGQAGHVNYDAIPSVVYTHPELAQVGLTEEECKTKGLETRVGLFPYLANGRAKSMEESDGIVKLIADAKTDRLLGAHIVGARASELIAELVTAIEFGGSAEDVARTCHAHPTLSEIVKEAALAVAKRQINL